MCAIVTHNAFEVKEYAHSNAGISFILLLYITEKIFQDKKFHFENRMSGVSTFFGGHIGDYHHLSTLHNSFMDF